ncbi:MAG: tatC [Phycisphaerales bacterium]|nr:tatC [Phycisphaerales bacterium]
MSTATETEPNPTARKAASPIDYESKNKHDFDPDSFRMTIGEHLEDLRWRLVKALLGLFIALLGCLTFSERVVGFFCAPLNKQLLKHDISPQMFYTELTEPFMTYLKMTIICAVAIAGPWIIYQIWQFVAAGLYPNERKMVTRYIPLSITLFVTGLVFVYVLVLPVSIGFFLDFSSTLVPSMSLPVGDEIDVKVPELPVIAGNPKHPQAGALWIDSVQGKLKVFIPDKDKIPGHGKIRVIPFGTENLVTPIITIATYIDLVLTFMLTFGIAFQLPLVILALVSLGIVDVQFLKKQRKMVYFVMTIASAFLAPGDIVMSMLALLIPLIILYEFGLWLVHFSAKARAERAKAEGL